MPIIFCAIAIIPIVLISGRVIKFFHDEEAYGPYLLSLTGLFFVLLILCFAAQYHAVKSVANGEYCYIATKEKVVDVIFNKEACEYLATKK